jgi:hypothetical protein
MRTTDRARTSAFTRIAAADETAAAIAARPYDHRAPARFTGPVGFSEAPHPVGLAWSNGRTP